MFKCARPGCPASGKSSCSSCGREQYCGSSCQKADWKAHKPMCSTLKKLSGKVLLSYREVVQVIDEVKASEKGKDIRVLEHLLSYADFQFGKRNVGKDYRERGNGERISNWEVEVGNLHKIVNRMTAYYTQDSSRNCSPIGITNLLNPHLERSLSLLNPWLNNLDSSLKEKTSHDQATIEYLLQVMIMHL
jgi:hypothetical protein